MKAKEAPIFAHFVKHLSSKNVTQYYEWVQKKENWILQYVFPLTCSVRHNRQIVLIKSFYLFVHVIAFVAFLFYVVIIVSISFCRFNAQLDSLNTRDGRPIDIILAPVHPLPTHQHGGADGMLVSKI